MKKRKIYILFLALLFTLSITAFAITAHAYTVVHHLGADGEDLNYDVDDLAGYFPNLKWENLDLLDINKTDGPYMFAPGASVGKQKENQLSFVLACLDENYVNYDTFCKEEKCYFVYQIILLREGNEGYFENCAYHFIYDYEKDELGIVNLGEYKQYQSNHFAPIMTTEDGSGIYGPSDFKFNYSNATDRYVSSLPDDAKYMRIYFDVESPYQNYRTIVRMQRFVKKQKVVWDLWPFKKHTETYNETIEEYAVMSDVRNYYQILNSINEAGKLETEFSNAPIYDYVQDVLLGEDREYNVEYLQDIEGTPFAKKVSAKITVRGWEDIETLNTVDVSQALDVKGVNTLISACSGFKKNSEGIFVADYYSGVYLEAKTVDGNVKQYILDPNRSYADFYSSLVDDGVITQKLYEYEFNEILKTFPELSGLAPEEVYGYFGYIVIPETFSLNQAYADLFNTQLKFDGVVNCFEFEEELTLVAYDKLLQDYNYAWLERLWNDVWGTLTQLNAKHVVMHADCTTSKAYGAMNGSEEIGNTAGLVGNEVAGVVEEIGNALDNTASSINKLLFGGGGQIPWLLIFGLIILGAWILPKIQSTNKSKSTKRRR